MNIEDRNAFDTIFIDTRAVGGSIEIDNSGALVAQYRGISARSFYNDSGVLVINSGAITAGDYNGIGIFAYSGGAGSSISISNESAIDIVEIDGQATGIRAFAFGDASAIGVFNEGDITITDAGGNGTGIFTNTQGEGGNIFIENSGDISVTAGNARGIYASTEGDAATIYIVNQGQIDSGTVGIRAESDGDDSGITIDNRSGIDAGGIGIYAYTNGEVSSIEITNAADIASGSSGIQAGTSANFGAITVTNSAEIDSGDIGIRALSFGSSSDLSITNTGIVASRSAQNAIDAVIIGTDSSIEIGNEGSITSSLSGIRGYAAASGATIVVRNAETGDIRASGVAGVNLLLRGGDSYALIENSGDIVGEGDANSSVRIYMRGDDNDLVIANTGRMEIENETFESTVYANAYGNNTTATIRNSGEIIGGIEARSSAGTNIGNYSGGIIEATDLAAIQVGNGAATISNAGTIVGYINTDDENDVFENLPGGVFDAVGDSNFGGGIDSFGNAGTVRTALNGGVHESVMFIGLETFTNTGLIDMQDGGAGDKFRVSGDFNGGEGSRLAIDAELGGANPVSDTFTVDGNLTGLTTLSINNTATGAGALTGEKIPVFYVEGDVTGDELVLEDGTLDVGFASYELAFVETGSGFFELRPVGLGPVNPVVPADPGAPVTASAPRAGAGAFVLPQLLTALQNTWHQTSDTWFNRSADLRTALRGGAAVAGAVGRHDGSYKDGPVVHGGGLAPAIWAKASSGWLDRDETISATDSVSFNLNRELHVSDFQAGVDFGRRNVLSSGDALLFSVFGGGVSGNLRYDALRQKFGIDGAQAGVAATYVSGGLFLDALFNAQFLEVEPDSFAFPDNLDSETYGFRLDAGYRFQPGRFFFEPLLTLTVSDSSLDGFSLGGNSVAFDDETSVRGRAGLRAGTTARILGVHAEPYVIASVWSELGDGDRQRATLRSGGAVFALEDRAEGSWTEISVGSNYFLFGNNAVSAFTKTDITFGDDIDGYSFTGGFRVEW